MHRFILVVLLLGAWPLAAEEENLPSYPLAWGQEFVALAKSPVFWGLGVGGLGASILIKRETTWNDDIIVHHDNHDRGYRLIKYGDYVEVSPMGHAVLAFFFWSKSEGLAYFDAWMISGGLSVLIKVPVDEKRPSGTGYGWPSGHTVVIASASGAAFGMRKWWQAAWYTLATSYVAYTRHISTPEMRAAHSFSQVFGGATFGWAVGYVIGRYHLSFNLDIEKVGYKDGDEITYGRITLLEF